MATLTPTLVRVAKLFGVSVVASAVRLVGSVVVLRTLSVPDFGAVAVYTNIAITFSGLIGGGLNLILVSHAAALVDAAPGRARSMATAFGRVQGGAVAVAAAVLLLSARPIAERWFGLASLAPYVRWAVPALAAGVATAFLQALMQSQRAFRIYAAFVVAPPVLTAAAFWLLRLSGHLSGANVVVAATGVSLLAAVVEGLVARATPLARATPEAMPRQQMAGVVRESSWIIVNTVSTGLVGRIDLLLLGRQSGLTEVGLYSFATTLHATMALLLLAANTVVLPDLARLRGTDGQRLAVRRVLGVSLALVAVALPAVLLVGPAVELVFGAKYLGALPPLYVMLGGLVVSFAFNPATNVLLVRGEQRFMALVGVAMLGVQVAACWYAVPRFGMMGAAVATTASHVLANTAMFWRAFRARPRPGDGEP